MPLKETINNNKNLFYLGLAAIILLIISLIFIYLLSARPKTLRQALPPSEAELLEQKRKAAQKWLDERRALDPNLENKREAAQNWLNER